MSSVLLLLIVLIGVGVIVGLVIIVRGLRREPAAMPAASPPPPPSREERKKVLEQLARGELTKDQAEDKMGQLGTPVPQSMPQPAPRPNGARGCLAAILIALLLIPLLLLLLFAGHYVSIRSERKHQEHSREPQLERIERVVISHLEAMQPPIPQPGTRDNRAQITVEELVREERENNRESD